MSEPLESDDEKLEELMAELARQSQDLESALAKLADEADEAWKVFDAHQEEDEKRLNELLAQAESFDFDAMFLDIGIGGGDLSAPPEPEKPYVDPAPNATADDVAQWMTESVRIDGRLSQHRVVLHIIDHFGRKFLYKNRHSNHAIQPKVLKAFWQMTPDVVWAYHGHYWRMRRDGDDPPRRRRVKE